MGVDRGKDTFSEDLDRHLTSEDTFEPEEEKQECLNCKKNLDGVAHVRLTDGRLFCMDCVIIPSQEKDKK